MRDHLIAAGERGQSIYVLDDVLSLLEGMERAIEASDEARFQGLRAKLADRIKGDPRALEFVFDVLRVWPWNSDEAELYVALVRVVQDGSDPEARDRLLELLQRRERDILASRVTDPGEVTRLLDFGSRRERMAVLQLLQESELFDAAVRAAVNRVVRDAMDPEVREAAVMALLRAPEEGLDPLMLMDLLDGESAAEVRRAIVRVLSFASPGDAVSRRLIDVLESSTDLVEKRFAAQGLGRQETTPELVATLLAAFDRETDFSLGFNLVQAAGSHAQDPVVARHLESLLLSSTNPDFRAVAALELYRSPFASAVQALRWAAENDPVDIVRRNAERALQFREMTARR